MPKKVDHEQRKELILGAALDVFARAGYKDTTLSLIAEEAGVPRTVVYQYYHDKNEVLYSMVRTKTASMFVELSKIASDESYGDEADQLLSIFSSILDVALENIPPLTNLLTVMIDAQKNGSDLPAMVRKRTIKLLILVKRILSKGINSGTFRAGLDVKKAADAFFSMTEFSLFSLAVYGRMDKEEALARFRDYLSLIKA